MTRNWNIHALLCLLFVVVADLPAQSSEEAQALEEELQSAQLGIDRDSLMKFLERRSRFTIPTKELETLTTQLKSDSYSDRQAAWRAFMAYGSLSIPTLREIASDPDGGESARWAKRCLQKLRSGAQATLTLSTARLLAMRQAEGAIPLLLEFLPNVRGEDAMDGLANTILDLAAQKEKLPPALLKAIKDPLPLRRGLVIDAIRGRDVIPYVEVLREALKDDSPIVRLKAAQGLTQLHDEQCILTFIQLITELPMQYAQQAEDELLQIAGEQAPTTSLDDTDVSRRQTSQTWEKWWKDQKAERLINELVKRTLTEEKHKRAGELLVKLGDDVYLTREAAQKDLIKMGPSIAPLLRQHVSSDDPEVSQRSQEILVEVDKESGGPLSPDVPRLLAFSKSEGAIKAMFDYLPFAENEEVRESILRALHSLAVVEGKVNQEIVEALKSDDPLIRAASIQALCQPGQPEMLKRAKDMLKDPEQLVRLRAALALVKLQQRDAMPTLLRSMAYLSRTESQPAQDFLLALAPADAPPGTTDTNPEARSKAWQQWWEANGNRIQLVSARRIERGRTHLGYLTLSSPYTSEVIELDRKGKRRWTIRGVSSPRDAVVISKNRILVLETGTRRLTERDQNGKVLNSYTYPPTMNAVAVQALRNGNRLLVGYNQILELTPKGKTLWTFNRPNNDIRSARRLRNGEVIVFTSNGQVLRVNRAGRILKSWNVFRTSYVLGYHILPNGHVLLPNKYGNQVVEYDTNGKQVWMATVQRPEAVTRLPDGTTVVASGNSPYSLYFFDRKGKQTKVIQLNMRVMNINHR